MQESLFETKEILQNTDKIKAQSNWFKPLLHDIVSSVMRWQSLPVQLTGRVLKTVAGKFLRSPSGVHISPMLDSFSWKDGCKILWVTISHCLLLTSSEMDFVGRPILECRMNSPEFVKIHIRLDPKVWLVTSVQARLIVGMEASPGKLYDGLTYSESRHCNKCPESLDLNRNGNLQSDYRGHNDENKYNVWIVNRFRKRVSYFLCRWWKQRSVIEPVIEHCKSEHWINRNQLYSSLGDELNVIFVAVGCNILKLM